MRAAASVNRDAKAVATDGPDGCRYVISTPRWAEASMEVPQRVAHGGCFVSAKKRNTQQASTAQHSAQSTEQRQQSQLHCALTLFAAAAASVSRSEMALAASRAARCAFCTLKATLCLPLPGAATAPGRVMEENRLQQDGSEEIGGGPARR